jgi:hypothetical protein
LLGGTWASPGAIGSTTPAAGSFTTINSTGNATIGGSVTARSPDGVEGGHITLNNKANTVGAYNFDVDTGDHGRLFTAQNNTNLSIGQLAGTGGVVKLFTGGVERAQIDASGNVLVTNAAGLGYGTGAGGTVTQATSKGTAVTLNKPTGQITMNGASLASGATVAFLLYNTVLTNANDQVVVSLWAGNANYALYSVAVATGSGSAYIIVKNEHTAALADAVVLNFAIIKGSTS